MMHGNAIWKHGIGYIMANGHKTQSFMKNRGQQKYLDKALVTIKNIYDYESIHSENPFYLITGEVDGHIEKNNGKKLDFCFYK